MKSIQGKRSTPVRRWHKLLALLAVFALVAAACGSDGDDEGAGEEGSGSETTAEAPTGEPIKVMTVTTLNASGPTYENIANTAEVYAGNVSATGRSGGESMINRSYAYDSFSMNS